MGIKDFLKRLVASRLCFYGIHPKPYYLKDVMKSYLCQFCYNNVENKFWNIQGAISRLRRREKLKLKQRWEGFKDFIYSLQVNLLKDF